jgi:hypothetical protein
MRRRDLIKDRFEDYFCELFFVRYNYFLSRVDLRVDFHLQFLKGALPPNDHHHAGHQEAHA